MNRTMKEAWGNCMDSIPNIHYIGVIESDGERVAYKKYPIELPYELLNSLETMQGDVTKTILDMQAEVERFYPPDVRKWFIGNHLAPLCYNATFVHCVSFPAFLTAYADLVARRVAIERMMDAFDIMRVR